MSCKDVPRDDCKDVPVQSCNDVPREVCKEVAREECSKVPREVSKKVQEKVCGIVDHKTCRPVPKEVCTDVADKVPREVCVDVPRQLCEEEPFQVSKEVCVDVPEEKCWDEKVTVTTYTKEKQCKQVMVETCRTKREAIQPALRKIASLSPSTDSQSQVNWQSYSQQVLGSPLAVRSSPLDNKSPSAKAVLSLVLTPVGSKLRSILKPSCLEDLQLKQMQKPLLSTSGTITQERGLLLAVLVKQQMLPSDKQQQLVRTLCLQLLWHS